MNDQNENETSYAVQDAASHYEASAGYAPGGHDAPRTPSRPPKRGMSAGAVIAVCLVCALLAAALGAGGTWFFLSGGFGGDALSATATATPAPSLAPAQQDAAVQTAAVEAPQGERIYELAKKQVVGVTTEITYANYFGQISSASVSGTGFIISDDGYILTNNHVIEDARKGGYEVSVLLYDGTAYTAQIVGYDTANDIAVLKIDADGLEPVTMGSAEDIVVGREIYPVGNPLGELNFSMSTGIISATDRTITTDTDSAPINMFQIDAAVNEGNSGGPVYDGEGEVIGVVTAKTSQSGTEGLGFAIPIEDAAHVADQIMRYGYVTDRATLGVSGITVTESMAQRYGMVVGSYVPSLTPDGPAAQAGVQEQDIITAVDGKPVTGFTELTGIVRTYAVGDTAELTVWRRGETLTIPVTFGESQPPEEEPATQQQTPQQQVPYGFGSMDDFIRQFFGFGF